MPKDVMKTSKGFTAGVQQIKILASLPQSQVFIRRVRSKYQIPDEGYPTVGEMRITPEFYEECAAFFKTFKGLSGNLLLPFLVYVSTGKTIGNMHKFEFVSTDKMQRDEASSVTLKFFEPIAREDLAAINELIRQHLPSEVLRKANRRIDEDLQMLAELKTTFHDPHIGKGRDYKISSTDLAEKHLLAEQGLENEEKISTRMVKRSANRIRQRKSRLEGIIEKLQKGA